MSKRFTFQTPDKKVVHPFEQSLSSSNNFINSSLVKKSTAIVGCKCMKCTAYNVKPTSFVANRFHHRACFCITCFKPDTVQPMDTSDG
jgi:hypothetical protein